jgi:hypothetical protein
VIVFTNPAGGWPQSRVSTNNDQPKTTGKANRVLAFDWDPRTWPGANMAFLVSLFATLLLMYLGVFWGKRRKPGTPLSWGEAMAAAGYVFLVLFMAFGVVPHQWLVHVQNGLGWRADKIVYGPGGLFRSHVNCKLTSSGGRDCGFFPFDINYLQVGDAIVGGIYVFFLGMQIYMFGWWQKRGKTTSTAVATSAFGRPLVKKS